MTSEQLLATRAVLWRQKGEQLLTLEDAQSWLLQSGLCLFLPRKAQIAAPAPTFVEACLGETNPTPPRVAIESAKNLLVRVIEAGSALPLNLLGTPSDHPDFLVSLEAFPFVYALRGDRDWKLAPGSAGANRVSPLITQVWKLLARRGVLTASEIQGELGRELTEAATLRALHELWASLRVIPLYQSDGQETLWEPLQSRHQKAMNSGVGMSQVTALSVLASVYLQSVLAASGSDVEAFLSPLASRSRVREVIRGLSATRQLAMIQMETHSLLYVEGSLPEFPEAEKPAAEALEKPIIRRPHPTAPVRPDALPRRTTGGTSGARPLFQRPEQRSERRPDSGNIRRSNQGGSRETGRIPQRGGERSFRPAAGARPDSNKREGRSYRPAPSDARPFKPGVRPIQRSEPGTGLRPDGTPKKTRWRDMPGGRPDQKGKPARFGPRKPEGQAGEESARAQPRREFRPSSPAPQPSGGGARPPFRPTGDRPLSPGSRPPSRSGAQRFGSRPAAGGFSKPRREDSVGPGRGPRDGASAGGRKFSSKPPQSGGSSSRRPSSGGGSRPYTSRPHGSSPGRPSSLGRPAFGKPLGRPPAGKPFKSYAAGKSPSGPGYKAGGQGRAAGGRPASRPGFGQGPKPGGGRFSPGAGRPRTDAGPKRGGSAKFKPRPGASAPKQSKPGGPRQERPNPERSANPKQLE